ncbi:hypothetical protein BdWA1_000493 [Babesia duncani]|uniref:Uncharacterized protein n=1 Tax=Babesia duncani TaxID=323732 RepID=A0AAD9PMG0_9APIC|nr:hypothetical protein BdWA1_000493 [Babesia duncani]
MTVISYSLVAQEDTVIADYIAPRASEGSGNGFNVNLDAVARNYLIKVPRTNCNGSTVILGHYFYHNELESSISRQVLKNTSKRGEFVTRILNTLVTEYNITNYKLKSIESNLLQTTDTLRGNISELRFFLRIPGNILERGELLDSIALVLSFLDDSVLVLLFTLKLEKMITLSRFFLLRHLLKPKHHATAAFFPALLMGGVLGKTSTNIYNAIKRHLFRKPAIQSAIYFILGMAIGILIGTHFHEAFSGIAKSLAALLASPKQEEKENGPG